LNLANSGGTFREQDTAGLQKTDALVQMDFENSRGKTVPLQRDLTVLWGWNFA
jgi:hypothetical protein